jgi:hypothetical protein
MPTIFPLSASAGQQFQDYIFDGESWNIIGENWKPFIYSATEPDFHEAGFIWVDSNEVIEEISYVSASGYQILTNKVMDGDNNYFSNIPESATLPNQDGNSGKYLTTSGSVSSWGVLDLTPYLTQISASNTYLTQASGSSIYLTQNSASSLYITQASASANYLTQASASTIYLDKTSASTTYQNKVFDIVAAKTSAYTFASGDENKIIELNGTFTVTIPPDSTFNFPIGTYINILQITSGTITIAGGVGVTVNGSPGLKLNSQWSGASIVKRSSNTWVAVGDLAA